MFEARLTCSWIGAFGLAAGAFGQTNIRVDPLPGPAPTYLTIPQSINNAGAITGYYQTSASDLPHGFVRDPSGMTTTLDIQPFGTAAYSINDLGSITGAYADSANHGHGFIRDPQGNITSFDPPGSISTGPQSINNRGVITGSYFEANRVFHGFVRYDNGTLIRFDPAGSVKTTSLSINAKGAVTGYYLDAKMRQHGFLREPEGTIVAFDPPESTATFVAAINNAGMITGAYMSNGRTYGFVRNVLGEFTSFDPGAFTVPTGINDDGSIIGYYTPADVPVHGFVRSPDGTITLIDPPSDPTLCSGSLPWTYPRSINENGVITGSCFTQVRTPEDVGWVRYP